jgi:hypothetical protein
MAAPVMEEGKLLSEALNTVKIQVQQMKRHLVRSCPFHLVYTWLNDLFEYRNWTSLWML